jgi:homeobox protein cut-like
MTDTTVLQSVQTASQLWSAYDWNGKRTEQDATLAQCKESRDASLSARKHLADTTKQFKRSVKAAETASSALATSNTPETAGQSVAEVESLAKQCRLTVKSYQEEIDNLTRRCKASESAYSSLGHALQELPNPAAVLELTLTQMNAQQAQMAQLLKTVTRSNEELHSQEQEKQRYKKELDAATKSKSSASNAASSSYSKDDREELVQLRREVAEYEVEFRSLKNQDITIRKLESRIGELQTSGEEEFKQELSKAKEELAETEGRRATEALEREAAMERRVQTLELQLKAEQAGRDATQEYLFEADEGVSQREAAWEAQRRILVDDSERVRESLQAAVRERDELRLSVAAVQGDGRSRSSGPTPPPSGGISLSDLMLERKAYEAEVAELSETAALLRDELRAQEDATVDEKRGFQTRIDALQREKASLNSNLSMLETQVASAPSQALVENMKRELRILKRLEYNADDVDADRDPEIAGGAGDEEKDLETVLVGKLRRAESELVTERTTRTDLSKEVDSLKRALADAEQTKDEAEKLVSSLERDLELAIVTPVTPKTSHKKKDTVPMEENPATLQSILDPNAPPPPPPPANASPSLTPSAAEKERATDDDHSVATIVMAQRDRLRARCEALEAERDSFKRELQGQVGASESLKADNTKLYEKVRYLQNYNKGPSNRGAYNRTSGGDRDLDLEALEQRYEASVDPFRQFSKSERQRKLNDMSPMERTVFIVAKTVLCKCKKTSARRHISVEILNG